MEKDLISRKVLTEKLEKKYCTGCSVCSEKCRYYELLDIIRKLPAAYDADWVERRLGSMFRHHAATKTVRRLVLETVQDGYFAAADNDRSNEGTE